MVNSVLKYALLLVLLLGGWFTDWQSKQWAQANLKGKAPVVFVNGVLELGFAENRGMVFGMLNEGGHDRSKKILLVMRVLILLGVTVFMFAKRRERLLYLLPLVLIWSGALGNVIDSLRYGFVIDFIHLHLGQLLDWPFLFNLADAYLCIGIVIISIAMLRPARKTVAGATSLG